MGLFTRRRRQATDTSGLGASVIALRVGDVDVAPVGTALVIFNAAGYARRAVAGRVAPGEGETVYCVHPGPYSIDLIPFAAAPELGLRLRFLIDASDPRVTQQRFDLFLFSEAEAQLSVAAFGKAIESALQSELSQGALDLPPCTTLEEWHVFRAGLNQLLYTRFGVTVDDCVPVDLGDQIDYADVLKARAAEAAVHAPPMAARDPAADAEPALHTLSAASPDGASVQRPPATAPSAAAAPVAWQDAYGLRRLFLELPGLSRDLRLLVLPEGSLIFQPHQALLLRLGMAALNVNTMPSLAWAAPDQPLAYAEQVRRAGQTLVAIQALDEAWALLARFQRADHAQWPALLEEADRICANLETGLAFRRAPHAPRTEPSL